MRNSAPVVSPLSEAPAGRTLARDFATDLRILLRQIEDAAEITPELQEAAAVSLKLLGASPRSDHVYNNIIASVASDPADLAKLESLLAGQRA